MKKVYVVGPWVDYASWIEDHELVDNIKDADIVLFTGGEDVNPSIYGKVKHPRTYSNLDRDLEEREIFKSVSPKQLCLGICRGSQLMCALNGGILVQDCNGHALWHTHEITNGSYGYQITSTHHQMQYPFNLPKDEYKMLYWTRPRSDYYEGDGIVLEEILKNGDPEIVLYTRKGLPRCLAVQGHPEMMRKDAPVITMLNTLLNDLLNK